ncbi:MAG: YeiH family putative sulfate export transporter [Epsilonproteobacteria bacterium]|nr:YeiH family putative sulfate export transporter [Campylobacterota bacterium]
MPFSLEKRNGTIFGILFVAIIALVATILGDIEAIKKIGISPLVIGIVIGIVFANTLHDKMPSSWESGITFSGKKILRFAIVFYGFRITFQEIADVGLDGFLISLIMLSTTFILGTWAGVKLFGLDRDTSMLTASGASVCGAAAVLATEPVLMAQEHKVAIAVSMVVLFGTIAMFAYPVMYTFGVLDMTQREFGIYVGATIHEVAQVVAVGGINGSESEMAKSAVIVKMTRVIMIAPMLIVLGIYLSFMAKREGNGVAGAIKIVIPWFAVYFIGVAGLNSLIQVYIATTTQDIANSISTIIRDINFIDTFLLTMAMSALGISTRFSKFKGLGLAPLYTALLMFIWLVVGGYVVVKVIC